MPCYGRGSSFFLEIPQRDDTKLKAASLMYILHFFALNAFHVQLLGEGSNCGQSPSWISAFCLHVFIEQCFPSAVTHFLQALVLV